MLHWPGWRDCVTFGMDDRRCCGQRGNMRSGVCVVAKPGGLVSAVCGYRPATGIRQRRAANKPKNQRANCL